MSTSKDAPEPRRLPLTDLAYHDDLGSVSLPTGSYIITRVPGGFLYALAPGTGATSLPAALVFVPLTPAASHAFVDLLPAASADTETANTDTDTSTNNNNTSSKATTKRAPKRLNGHQKPEKDLL